MSDDKETIEQVLENMPNGIGFDDLAAEEASPLNEPVAEGEIGVAVEQQPPASPTVEDVDYTEADEGDDPEPVVPEPPPSAADFEADTSEAPEQPLEEPDDAQEYDNGDASDQPSPSTDGAEVEMPEEHANLLADAILGMTDNVLTFGGGFFVKIKKRKEFLEFEAFRENVDAVNQRNLQRLKLDESDKALLRPLLKAVLRKKAKKLTPEQALIGAVVSILMKKVQDMVEIRQENKIFEERVLAEIRALKAAIQEESRKKQAAEQNIVDAEVEEDDTGSDTTEPPAQAAEAPMAQAA